jgi:YhcG PDDEXK nuclease domain/Protein of unknown function DUF86
MDLEVVLVRLRLITKYLNTLEEFRDVTIDEYLDNFRHQLSVERLLQLMAEAATDINKYMLVQLHQISPDTSGNSFIEAGSQYRLEIDDEEYFIDLVLYHRLLKCLVAVELKIGKFLPEYIGKMQFYLAALDDRVRLPDENPSIGIILCKSKNKTIVEYALRESNKPIGVASYKIVSTVPNELKNQLPAPEQVAKLLQGIE